MSLLKGMCKSSRSAFREANDQTRPNPLALLASIFDRGRLGLLRTARMHVARWLGHRYVGWCIGMWQAAATANRAKVSASSCEFRTAR
mgnify:CR=1 FL=1